MKTLKSTYKLNGFNGPKFPKLKGHVKITMHNCKNGKNEVVAEGDNIVTNAVRDILLANIAGGVDYSKIFGANGLWKKWFGGVLLYEQAHTLDPDNYYPLADSASHLFAHAGQTSIDADHDDDLTRGNPVAAAYVLADNAVKQVWEWGPSRGNVPDGRFIRALSLTHSDTGDVGLGSNTYAFKNFVPMEKISQDTFDIVSGMTFRAINNAPSMFGQYDDSHGFYFTIGEDGDYYAQDNNWHVQFQTNDVTVYIKRFPFNKAGLYETWNVDTDHVRKFKVTSANITFYVNPCYYFDYENKYLWLFSNATGLTTFDNTNIKYIVIDCESGTEIDHGTFVSDVSDIAPLGWVADGMSSNYRVMTFPMNIIKQGDYFLFPKTTGAAGVNLNIKGYQKINANNPSDQSIISFLENQAFYTQPIYGGGLTISLGRNGVPAYPSTGRVTNGATGYTCAAGTYNSYATVDAYGSPYKPTSFRNSVGGQSGQTNFTRTILANKMLNTTLFNLPDPVQKTSSQSMIVEYTLQEAGDES